MMKIAAVLAAVALTTPALAGDSPADKGAQRGMMKSTGIVRSPSDKSAERGMTKTLNNAAPGDRGGERAVKTIHFGNKGAPTTPEKAKAVEAAPAERR